MTQQTPSRRGLGDRCEASNSSTAESQRLQSSGCCNPWRIETDAITRCLPVLLGGAQKMREGSDVMNPMLGTNPYWFGTPHGDREDLQAEQIGPSIMDATHTVPVRITGLIEMTRSAPIRSAESKWL